MDHSNNDRWDGLAHIELYVSVIREWMKQHMLKLNDDKTENIVFTSKYKHDLCEIVYFKNMIKNKWEKMIIIRIK